MSKRNSLQELRELTEKLANRASSPENMDLVAAFQSGIREVVQESLKDVADSRVQLREALDALESVRADLRAARDEIIELKSELGAALKEYKAV